METDILFGTIASTQQVPIENMKTTWYIGPNENIIGKATSIQ